MKDLSLGLSLDVFMFNSSIVISLNMFYEACLFLSSNVKNNICGFNWMSSSKIDVSLDL